MRQLTVPLAVLLVLAGCGGTADPLATPPGQGTDAPTSSGPGVIPTGAGLDLPPPCLLAADHVQALIARLEELRAINGVEFGPPVVVPVEGTADEHVVTLTVIRDGGGRYDPVSWLVEGDTPPLLPLTREAAELSLPGADTSRMLQPDANGAITLEGPIGSAIAFGEDCSLMLAQDVLPPPPPPEPTMREDLLVATPSTVTPGDVVELTFPEGTARGVAFQLDEQEDGDWLTRWLMTSDANGGEPVTVPANSDGYGVEDVGIEGPGPDRVLVHRDTAPGSYRLCTANAGEDFCTPLDVAAG